MQVHKYELDDIDSIDIEDMWSGRDSDDDERNIEFFVDTDHIKLL